MVKCRVCVFPERENVFAPVFDVYCRIATGRLQADIDLIGSALDGLNTVKCETTEAEAVLGGLRIAAKTVKKLATELKNVVRLSLMFLTQRFLIKVSLH